MAGEGGFLARWSKRKLGDLPESEVVLPPEPIPAVPVSASEEQPFQLNLPDVPEVEEPAFDLASLPTLDELTGTSDMSAFLQKGVPDALRNAALRKAWVLDPMIRDHVEPIECGWDFNDPNSMTGFGALDADVDPAAMLKQIMGQPEPTEEKSGEQVEEENQPEVPPRDDGATSVASGQKSEITDAASGVQEEVGLQALEIQRKAGALPPSDHAATQHDRIEKIEEIPPTVGKRRHGGAVPG